MGWLVGSLLRNKVSIRADADIESDDFNDLISIETKAAEMRSKKLLTDFDIKVIDFVSSGLPFSMSKSILGIGRTVASKYFSNICHRIAYHLGGHFTNEGYIEMLIRKHNLTDDQVQLAWEYITGRYRPETIRRTKTNESNK